MSCFICLNMRHDKTGNVFIDESLKLFPSRLKWTMFDGSEHDIEIHRCQECIDEMEDLESPEKGSWVEMVQKKLAKSAVLPVLMCIPLWVFLK